MMTSLHGTALRGHIAEPRVRRNLTAMLRRRVGADAAEDLAQSVLCAALDSEANAPDDPRDFARWIFGIARHKVADFRRSAGRVVLDSECDRVIEPAPFEERAMLKCVVAEAARDPQNLRTFDWIIRETDGEQLSAIADEAGISRPIVRKRVSRLRRVLRLIGAAAALVIAGAGISEYASTKHPPIVAESVGEGAVALDAFQGTWFGERGEITWRVTIRGASVDVVATNALAASPHFTRSARVSPGASHNEFVVTLVDSAGARDVVDATLKDGALIVTLRDPTHASLSAPARIALHR